MLENGKRPNGACHRQTWTWCRQDLMEWSCEETLGSAGCRTPNELQHSGPRQAGGQDGHRQPPPAAAEPNSTAAPIPPAGRRRWPGGGLPHNAPEGWMEEVTERAADVIKSDKSNQTDKPGQGFGAHVHSWEGHLPLSALCQTALWSECWPLFPCLYL